MTSTISCGSPSSDVCAAPDGSSDSPYESVEVVADSAPVEFSGVVDP